MTDNVAPRVSRWPLWVGAGVLCGLGLGFLLGLTKPRVPSDAGASQPGGHSPGQQR